MSKPLYIKLRNGAIIDASQLHMIVRKDLNEYGIVIKDSQIVIRGDADDVKFIESKLELEETPAPAEEPKVVAA